MITKGVREIIDKMQKKEDRESHFNKLFIMHATLILLIIVNWLFLSLAHFELSVFRAFSPIDDLPLRCHVQATIHRNSNATILRMYMSDVTRPTRKSSNVRRFTIDYLSLFMERNISETATPCRVLWWTWPHSSKCFRGYRRSCPFVRTK